MNISTNMSSSSSNADLFNRLQLFRSRSGDFDEEDSNDDQRKRVDPSQSKVKRCLFGRGNTEENIKFAKRELEKSLEDSKRRWNFDFVNERPLDGRFVWQTPPYPKLLKAATNTIETENVENLHPEQNPNPKAKNSTEVVLVHTSSSDAEHTCDQPDVQEKLSLKLPAISSTKSSSSTSSTSSEPGQGSPSQRRSHSRQSSINNIFRQRRRSKSKVKVQERKTEKETSPESATSSKPPEAGTTTPVSTGSSD